MAGRYDLTIDQGATLRRSFQWQTPPAEPVDITGCHLRARIFREGTPNPELVLTDQTGELTIIDPLLGLFDLEVEDEVTDTLLWPKGSWRLDVLHASGAVTALREGAVTVRSKRGDTNGSNGADETVILMTVGIQGPEGPPGTTDASEINTGTLPPAQMPGLTGDVTTIQGTVATMIGADKVHFAMLNSGAWSDDVSLVADSSTQLPTQHAVKTYVDNFVTGLQWKAAVACASNGPLTLTGEQLVDGIATSNSRVLVKNQVSQKDNGIYISAAGAWVRAPDANTAPELTSATVSVTGGIVNGHTAWTCNSDLITIGSSAVTFAQVSGAGTYTAGAGLNLNGNSFSIATGGVTLAMLAPGVGVYTAGAGLALAATSFSIAAGGVTLAMLATGVGVYTAGAGLTLTANSFSIAAGAVTAAMIAPMTSSQLAGLMTDETGSGALVFANSPTLAGTLACANITQTGTLSTSVNGALSAPGIFATGTWITTGGTATTTKPYVLIEPASTTSTGWNTAGTALGVNAPSSFLGTLLDLQWNGVSKFSFSIPSSALIVGTVILAGTALGYLTLGGTGFDLRNAGFASFTITNPTIQWPNSTPDVTLTRQGAGVLQIGTIAAGNALGSLMCANIKAEATNGTKIGTLTSEKLGFWGAAPVAQQVLATGTGKTVDNVITMLQLIGLCKQS